MRHAKAALVGVVIAIAAGVVAGVGPAWLSLEHDELQDPSRKAAFYAATIAESINCAVFFMLVGVPAAIVIAHFRRKQRPGG